MLRPTKIAVVLAVPAAFALGRLTGSMTVPGPARVEPVEQRLLVDAPASASAVPIAPSEVDTDARTERAAAVAALGSPDPATVAGSGTTRDRRMVDRLLRQIERRGVDSTGESAPSKETVAAFSSGLAAALDERNHP